MHPKINGYSVLGVTNPRGEPGEEIEMFVGKIDGEYHLLGHRPKKFKYLFSENECSSQDLGKVILPEGKKSIRDLVEGDVIHVESGELDGVIYKCMK